MSLSVGIDLTCYIISVGASINSSGVYSSATNRGLSDSQCADEQCSKAQSKLDEITCEMLCTECISNGSCFESDMTDPVIIPFYLSTTAVLWLYHFLTVLFAICSSYPDTLFFFSFLNHDMNNVNSHCC